MSGIWVAFSKRSSDYLADRTATRGFSLVSRALQGVLDDTSDREEADGQEGQERQEQGQQQEEERDRMRARLARQLSTVTQTRKAAQHSIASP